MKYTHASQNGALNYSCRTTSVPEPESLNELLETRAREGFATSAYWGATGEVPDREPDDAIGNVPFPFKEEISRKLVPLPEEKTSFPRTLDYTLIGMHLMKGDGNTDCGGLNAAQLRMLNGDTDHNLRGTLSGSGDDTHSSKPRFLNLSTTTMSQPGAFSDNVLDTLRDGDVAAQELQHNLDVLKHTPFRGEDPDPYRLTSDDYCNMAGIDPSSYRVTEDGPNGKVGVYRSRYNNVEREGPKRRDRTVRTLQREHEVDHDALRGDLRETHLQTMPQGYSPPSAKDWQSTTHREHANYDVHTASTMNERHAVAPLRNINYQLSSDNMLTVSRKQERFQTRHMGDWATEYAQHYVDRSGASEGVKRFAGKSIFDIDHGVYTMNHHYHHPRADTATGETCTPTQLVPGQYATMSQRPLHARNKFNPC